MNRLELGLRLLGRPRRLIGLVLGPRVLVTSVPKAGTNMLTHTLSLFPQLTIEGTLALLPLAEQMERVAGLGRGRVVSTHLAPHPALDAILDRKDIKVVFISRDPRDVCVSLFHYIERERGHYFHTYYSTIPDAHSRLMTIIRGHDGREPDGTTVRLPSVDFNFRSRLGWVSDSRCCAVTFEQLVGPRGGGDATQQRAAVNRVARHLGVRLTTQDLDSVTSNIFSSKTSTFRRGQIGGWEEEMTAAHKTAFKETAGQLLIDLGYETGFDW